MVHLNRVAGVGGLALLALALAGFAQESQLLTNNGAGNDRAAAYRALPRLDTGGRYAPSPVFAGGDDHADRVPFAQGALTDGDVSYSSGTKPVPYAYWQGQPQAEVVFQFGRVYQVDKVRVHLLNSDDKGPHGTAEFSVFVTGDPLEFPDVLKVGVVAPAVNGWNELPVGRAADGLRLVFRRQEKKSYITLSEVEIWGRAAPGQAAAPEKPPATLTGDSPRRVQDGFTWWAFDFGPAKSPPFAGFCVCDAHAAYSSAKGFGWIPYRGGQPVIESNFGPASADIPGLGERDRGGKGSGVDSLFRDFVMTSAYYHTQVRQTFAVDVPSGAYRVMTLHGDTQYGRPGKQTFWIEAEARKVAEDLMVPVALTTDRVFDVTVADGRLDLTLDAAAEDPALCGFVLNGLVILPAGTPEARAFADRRVEMIRAAVQRERNEVFATRFREVPYVETATMVEPGTADRERGFVAWTPNWMTLVYPNSVPTAADVQRPLAGFATPGEYEPVVVALRTLRPLTAVRLEVADLAGPDGQTIPAAAIDVRTVRAWPQRLGSSWSTEWRVMPELLEKLDAVDLEKDTSREFWLTVHVPTAAKPGLYRGPVRLVTADGQRWEKELQFEVLPFTLLPAERVVGMYWRDTRWPDEILDRQVQDMVAHGITAVTVSRAPKVRNENGQLVVDTSELRTFLAHLRGLGITGPAPYQGMPEASLKQAFPNGDLEAMYPQAIAELEKVSNDPAALKLLYYPVDEIGGDGTRGKRAHDLCALVGKVPTATSYITVNNYAGGEKWGDTFDIWCGNIEYTPAQEQALLACGKRYMRYGSAYLNDCRKARNSCGFGFYRRPAEAMYYWHYQAYNGDPYNDFDGDARDWCAAYPGENGELIPTMDWESIREGVDDLRYIATLKALATRAEQGTPAQKTAATQARAELAAVLAVDDTVNQYTYAEKLSHDEFQALRRRLVDPVLALQQALGE